MDEENFLETFSRPHYLGFISYFDIFTFALIEFTITFPQTAPLCDPVIITPARFSSLSEGAFRDGV